MNNVWDTKYDIVYHVVFLIGHQLKMTGESGKIHKATVQNIKVTYPVDELLKCAPDEKAFGHAA